MRQGEVWLCTLDPTVGAEIRKTRPCLIVTPNFLNSGLRTVIVAPLTNAGRSGRFRVPVTFQGTPGLILPDQLRTLGKASLIKELGRVSDTELAATLAVLGEMFAS